MALKLDGENYRTQISLLHLGALGLNHKKTDPLGEKDRLKMKRALAQLLMDLLMVFSELLCWDQTLESA